MIRYLHSRNESDDMYNLIIASINIYVLDIIFDSPNWYQFLSDYQLNSKIKQFKYFLQLFIFSVSLALFVWQSKNNFTIKLSFLSIRLKLANFHSLVIIIILMMLISVIFVWFIGILYKSDKFKSIMLEHKNSNKYERLNIFDDVIDDSSSRNCLLGIYLRNMNEKL